jgi:hypothetical protein
MPPAPAVSAFRDQLRVSKPGSRVRGALHIAFTSVSALLVIVGSAALARDVRWYEWLVVPATFLFANVVEYFGHRGPLHRRRRALAALYERHTLGHHRFFTRERMACDSAADYRMILFPPVFILFFLGAIALPIAFLLFVLTTRNVGLLFVATAMSYFLTYEWLHFAYHLPEGSWVGHLPFVRALQRHHAIHHDMRRMTHCNFNITFPICDFVFGTLAREAEEPPLEQDEAEKLSGMRAR